MVDIRRLKNKIKAVLHMGGKCNECEGEFLPSQYDFHHVDGRDDRTPADLMRCSWDRIKDELKECELLCANCHRLRHIFYNNHELEDDDDDDSR